MTRRFAVGVAAAAIGISSTRVTGAAKQRKLTVYRFRRTLSKAAFVAKPPRFTRPAN
jgi:hypothetical protein